MMIYDARPVAARLSLDSEGLALFEHHSAVRDFYDEDELRRIYYPEAERLVAEVTGASRVLVFDHTIRRRVQGGIDRAWGRRASRSPPSTTITRSSRARNACAT
jgi:hypothetical protein